jgi:BirA family biotin operon repressor/biotin-[acetyl-CoA-carboxylase] ligase
MKLLAAANPFGAPVYHEETVSSTMDVSRLLAARGEPHGTVITADFQQAGRGRTQGRRWDMERKTSLPFTILLRYPSTEAIPTALTLRAGLAVSAGMEDFAPVLSAKIKWPNDIIIGEKKAAGIYCEADGGIVHCGIGINAAQKSFPPELSEKATSISLATGADINKDNIIALLEKVLARLYAELNSAGDATNGIISAGDFPARLGKRLYKIGERVDFMEGAAESGKVVTGILSGIGKNGELLINMGHSVRAFTTGELLAGYNRNFTKT